MYVEERRQHILELLKRRKRVDVSDLAGRLDISPETIRRDLNEMEADGLLTRTHGGAIYVGENTPRPVMPLHSRREMNIEKKSSIARAAAAFVESDDVIAIDNSTTACCMVEFIPADIKLTVITYSLQVILDVVAKPHCDWTCINLGGIVNPSNMSSHGVLARNALEHFRPRKFFMSCAGVDSTGMMTESTLLETEIKRALIKYSRQSFLLIDATKWGQSRVVTEGSVASLDYVITNAGVDPRKYAFLRNKKVQVFFDR